MYSISTGVVSKNGALMMSSVFVCIIYTAIFGASLIDSQKVDGSFNAIWVILATFVINAMIKFKYHVIDSQPYTDFAVRKD